MISNSSYFHSKLIDISAFNDYRIRRKKKLKINSHKNEPVLYNNTFSLIKDNRHIEI